MEKMNAQTVHDVLSLGTWAATALGEIVDSGPKNLLDLSKATSTPSVPGISYSIADDGALTVTWTNLSIAKTLKFKGIPYIAGNLILSGVQTLTVPSIFKADVRQGETAETRTDIRSTDYGQSPKESFTMINDAFDYVIRIGVPEGESSTSGTATIYPMICTEAAWNASNKYQPYRPSYDTLISKIAALEAIVPSPTADDTDKVLTATGAGEAEWATTT